MKVMIHQPDFIPWLGFFDRWENSDLLIILDDVQFIRRGWQHRDKIKTNSGVVWLTVPVIKKKRYNQQIRHVEIDNSFNWIRKHIKTIEISYSKAPGFNKYFDKINKIYNKKHNKLIDLNLELLRYISSELQIKTQIMYASELNSLETSTNRLVELVKKVGGTNYITGYGSTNYLEEEKFIDAGINVTWHDFKHPVYKQLYGDFVPNLSILDYIMNMNIHNK